MRMTQLTAIELSLLALADYSTKRLPDDAVSNATESITKAL